MTMLKTVASTVLLASTLALGGCVEDGYGYGGLNVGYGSGYYPGYYDDSYGPYGYSPYGWYDGYYYPGTGYYIYDRGGYRHRWSDQQRRYWEDRHQHAGQWNGPKHQPWRPELRNNPGNWQNLNPEAAGSPRARALREREGYRGYGQRGGQAPAAAPQSQPQAQPQAQPQPEARPRPSGGGENWGRRPRNRGH